jgi:hypothetical protein
MPARPMSPRSTRSVHRETFGQGQWLGPPLFAAVPESGHNAEACAGAKTREQVRNLPHELSSLQHLERKSLFALVRIDRQA